MTTSRLVATAAFMTMTTGLVAGWLASDWLPWLLSPLGQRYCDAGLGVLGSAAFTTSAVLCSRGGRLRSWLPPIMLLFVVADLRRVSEPDLLLLGIVAVTWFLSLVLQAPRMMPARVGAIVSCGASTVALHVGSVLGAGA